MQKDLQPTPIDNPSSANRCIRTGLLLLSKSSERFLATGSDPRHCRLFGTAARTRERLQSGELLRIVMLGDSIINDTFGGGLELMMSSQWPNANLSVIPSVRSATGVGYYQEKGRVKDYVIDLEPDLVIIGGVSHGYDLEATRSVVRQIQAASDAEILMLTGAMAPEDMFRMSMRRQTGLSPLKAAARVRAFNRGLPELASEMGAGFFDMRRVWDAYIYDSGLFSNCYHRDAVHGDITGKLLLASILARYLGQ